MKRTPFILSACFAALLLLGTAGRVQAAQISFVSASGNWHDPTDNGINNGAGDPVITNGVPTSGLRWGVGNPQSGYDFVRQIPGTQTLPPAPTPFFPLGTFTHLNFPVNDPSLTSVKLDVVLTLNVDGVVTGPLSFTFTFNHVETPNVPPAGGSCPYTTPAGEGCTDRVTFVSSPQPTTFNVGGVDYTLSMSFVDDQTGQPVSEFITREGRDNVANLVGQFTLPPPPVTCNDTICNGNETCSNCPTDCGVCQGTVSQIQFDPTSYSVNENGGLATITVTRTVITSGTSRVQFASSNGSATVGSDYVGVSGTLEFAPGQSVATFDVPVIDDRLTEGSETVMLNLSGPVNATLGTSQAMLTIVDQGQPTDPAPFISELVPNTAPVNHAGNFPMRVVGLNFDTTNSQVLWNNSVNLPVTSRTATEIIVTMTPSLWSATAGDYPVMVRNPGNVDSNSVDFTVRPVGTGNPLPWVNSLSATPNPTYTKTTNLSARGDTFSCNGGTCGEALLTYTWMLSGSNPSGAVTFSNNGSHNGRDSVATFPAAGTYHIFVRVTDPMTLFAVDSHIIDVDVVKDPKSLTVSPQNTNFVLGQTMPLNLTATVLDQWGQPMTLTNPPVWTRSAGALSPSGQTATFSLSDDSVRQILITASVTNALNATLSGNANVNVVVIGAPGGDLSNARAFPVPFKGNAGLDHITLSGLTPGTKIRLFTTDGRLIRTLDSPTGADVSWYIDNSDGKKVASGVYFYIIENGAQKKEGKVVIIL